MSANRVVYLGGPIRTMDESQPVVEAVGTIDDRIVAVGSLDEVRRVLGEGANEVDLQGRCLMPGFVEPHTHGYAYGQEVLDSVNLRVPPLGDVTSTERLLSILTDTAATTPAGEWILGARYDQMAYEPMEHPTRAQLDAVSSVHPIILTHRSGHTAVANSMALELAGVDEDTPDPVGGVYRRDAAGRHDGVLQSLPAVNSVLGLVPPPAMDRWLDILDIAQRDYLSVGITSTHDAHVTKIAAQAYQQSRDQGRLIVRTTIMPDPALAIDEHGEVVFQTGFGDDVLRIGSMKLWADGSVPGFTGWLSKPYHKPVGFPEDHCGHATFPPGQLAAVVMNAHRQGMQIAIHAGGDAAIDEAIDAIAQAQREHPREDARHRLEHCHYPREDQLDAMVELGITASFFVAHTYYWGDRYLGYILGPERARRISPLRSALDRGMRFSVHSDSPHVPADPLRDVYCATNRITFAGAEIGPEQRITVEEALRAVTIDAAWQGFAEDRVGSIESGKLADFVILSEDPTAVDITKIRDISVESVIIGGTTVFEASASFARSFDEPRKVTTP